VACPNIGQIRDYQRGGQSKGVPSKAKKTGRESEMVLSPFVKPLSWLNIFPDLK